MAGGKTTVYQIRIQLDDIRPPIWRRVLVPDNIALRDLHEVIQLSMGWTDSHLYMFEKGRTRYGLPEPDDFADIRSDRISLNKLLGKEKDSLGYMYDFGDGWSHKIILEKLLPHDSDLSLPTCIKGVRACPPEDCGGPWGYADLLEILNDPSHDEYMERREWVGDDFSPEEFDLKTTNDMLREYCRH